MKSYLGLVSEYARVHEKKNRLTVICIFISVMLVTAIFSMAEMSIQAQVDAYIGQRGNYHMIVGEIGDALAGQIGSRNDVGISGFLGMAEDMVYQGKELIVQSGSQELSEAMNLVVTEGVYPAADDEALLDAQGLEQFGLSIGDSMEIIFPDGQTGRYRISGTYGDFSSLKGTDAHGLMLAPGGLRMLPRELYQEYDFIQFKKGTDIRKAVSDIKAEYGLTDQQVTLNIRLLGLMGQSDDETVVELYLTAVVLFLMVAMAGVCMIASSFNMSIRERTRFFGLLRCLGATKKQVRRYIRLEGLQYCLKGIPLGLLTGCVVSWVAVLCLNALRIQDLPPMPVFQISLPGVASGTVIGVLVVMIASASPAKNAAKVSPQAAITGNIESGNHKQIKKAARVTLFPVDTAMGFGHAYSNRRSMILIAGSFGISIILFLCFSVLITFMDYAVNPLKPYAPDLSILGSGETGLLEPSLVEEINKLPHVKKTYARKFLTDIPAEAGDVSDMAMLVSYDAPQFEWAEDMLVAGSLESVIHGKDVLIGYGCAEEFQWNAGDVLTLCISGKACELRIGAIIQDVPFEHGDNKWKLVCSESSFTALTGISDYTIIDLQVEQDISGQIRDLIPPAVLLLDKQQRNKETRTLYYAMSVFVYGFLIVIAVVALINIVNTVNASVSGRMGNYGVMRAVGMSGKQLKRMVMAESSAYAVTGSITGGVIGLFLHRWLFGLMITPNWGDVWQPPLAVLAVAMTGSILAALLAVISPARKIKEMSIVNVVNEG